MAEATQVQDFKFTAVGRIKTMDSELITSANSQMRGKSKTTIVIESDQTNRNNEHPIFVVEAYAQKSVEATKFAVGDEVKVEGRIRGGAGRVGQDGFEHYRTSASLGKIEKAEGLEHGFSFEATGTLERATIGTTPMTGDAKAGIVLTRTFGQDGDKVAKIELNAYRGAAIDAGQAFKGDTIVAKGSLNSRAQVDFESNEVRTDANGRPYYNTYATADEIVNLTPHLEQSAPAPETAEVDAPAPF